MVSSAIPPENPERAIARERGQRELHRAELLGELTRLKPTIAISGTHGKTTTSSMVVHALRGCGMDPSYLVGGEVRSTGANAGWGEGEWLVVEADESDRSLLKLSPRIAVLTNAELDHHTTYSSRRDVDDTFRAFLALAEQAVVWDRPELLALAGDTPVTPFDVAGARAGGGRLALRRSTASRSTLSVPGAHNARNAAAALTACRLAGADLAPRPPPRWRTSPAPAAASSASARPPPARSWSTTTRTTRPRCRRRSRPPARSAPRRIVAVFQPHLFSRTRHQAREFGAALALADLVVVLDIYPARERQEDFPGVTGRLVAAAAADAAGGRPVAWLPGFDEAEAYLRAALREGDVLLTLGAGDVDALGRRLLA